MRDHCSRQRSSQNSSLGSQEPMSEYQWFKDLGSAHHDRTSCRCLERRSTCSGLQIKFKRWGQIKMVFLLLVKRKGIGADPWAFVGGCAPAGLNVNNNDDDNENNGVGSLRKSCYFPC